MITALGYFPFSLQPSQEHFVFLYSLYHGYNLKVTVPWPCERARSAACLPYIVPYWSPSWKRDFFGFIIWYQERVKKDKLGRYLKWGPLRIMRSLIGQQATRWVSSWQDGGVLRNLFCLKESLLYFVSRHSNCVIPLYILPTRALSQHWPVKRGHSKLELASVIMIQKTYSHLPMRLVRTAVPYIFWGMDVVLSDKAWTVE